MKTAKSKDDSLVISFEGWDYHFKKKKTVFITQKLLDHLKERYPLAFDFEVKPKRGQKITNVKKTKTKVFFKEPEEIDMKVMQPGAQSPTFGQADLTPPSGTTDKDGVSWYGEGVEIESTSEASFA
jgi:hypothetical protein